MKIILLFFLSFGCNLFAQDSEWNYIGTGTDKTKYYFKINSENTAWTKEESKETVYFVKNLKKTIDGYHLSLWKFDCDEKQIGIVQKNTYSKDGKLIDNISLKSYEVEMDYVVPDSIGESLIKSFCEK
ncbi:surface-adhesin E family protein [Faecalibacter sp. LW9]|uniref:surface-adhesin E family protein n=1 Tax=Faecalibacter sp. LW9 TaxID=3103144 RepID=UPI002AFF2B55|nr:surface-adhesin E family protein [Faecalibacter sp. LW9]